ncbi:MAG: SRPBCC domain-containing protein [Polyangiaceae bacterium]
MTDDLRLTTERLIHAAPERLFRAWTTPELLLSWWGPRGVSCSQAEVDLRVGGRYLIGNRLPDGGELLITGEFLQVSPPHELRYTWHVQPPGVPANDARVLHTETVHVRFEARGSSTLVSIVHERILDEATRVTHLGGWEGCLDGLNEWAHEATNR